MQNTISSSLEKPIRQVVLIDDDNSDNFLHARVLENSGLVEDVYTFEHAEDALAFLRSDISQIDMIFVDINMPRMDGYAFLDAFDELQKAQTIMPTIVILSTSIGPVDVLKASQFQESIHTELKPLNQEKLNRLIAKHVGRSPDQVSK